ncbi:PDZ and FERM M and FERM N and FERM C domain conta ining protein [Trichuris trichiura]|uniref:PDZ and FERM M and FERM N and FERM C domain conta ining protein n=1 Tax=Trichuris trichiura TaxID=36087 RepID=A0A077YYU4_TRITR|nr:PDZ and FERM M and FERM N and FERM C domain conta ining protein [Trichuris trichiura]
MSYRLQRKLFCKIRDGNVLVVLLNGQRVDVACKINCTALDIFEVVCTHTNLVERHFFGLTYLKDGEYFFLEPEQKIYRFAPPGWRHQAGENARVAFCLYLRLKFYPVVLDFVKTELTMYHIYLQLRHDIMDERLQCEQESAYQLAALALQAEVGDRPSQELYFEPQSYLPPAFLKQENIDRIRARLAQMHFRHAGKSSQVAEVEYVKMCQTLREFGIHFYRLYRTKPSHMLTPSPLGDPDTGVPLWIGIMNRGLVIFEEKGGFRIPLSHHPWHLTQTLQFDHKKFYIVARKSQNGLTLNKLTFFTDSYRKSSYFVNFAAAQHRFCMKMRTWASTLPKERRSGRCADSTESSALTDPQGLRLRLKHKPKLELLEQIIIEQNESVISIDQWNDLYSFLIEGEWATGSCLALRVHCFRDSTGAVANSSRRPHSDMPQPPNGAHQERPVDVVSACSATLPRPAVPSRRAKMANDSNGQPNKISFLSQDSGHSVSALTNDKTFSDSVSNMKASFVDSEYDIVSATLVKDPRYGLGLTLVDGEIQGLKGVYIRSMTVGGPAELDGRLKIGDKVTAINDKSLDGRSRLDAVNMVRESDASVSLRVLRLRCLYSSDESIDTAGANDDKKKRWSMDLSLNALNLSLKNELSSTPLRSAEEHAIDLANCSTMYSSLYNYSDSEEEASSNEEKTTATSAAVINNRVEPQNVVIPSVSQDSLLNRFRDKDGFGDIDWTNSIAYDAKWNENEVDLVEVVLEKNENGNLGIQVAGGKGQKRVYVKCIVGEPALSCPHIRPGDRLAMVNGQSTEGLSHADAVTLLRNAKSPVVLRLWRSRSQQNMQNGDEPPSEYCHSSIFKHEEKPRTLQVVLNKAESQPLGLSLGKPVTGAGIFIRSISPGSVAAIDGRLRVGDKICMIADEFISDLNPADVVQKLKAAAGSVRLTIERF